MSSAVVACRGSAPLNKGTHKGLWRPVRECPVSEHMRKVLLMMGLVGVGEGALLKAFNATPERSGIPHM